MDTIIATQGLTKVFSGKAVVNRLNLTVPRGAIFALLGGNGAGKSTTIRMLTGLLPPDAGRRTILGKDCWADGHRPAPSRRLRAGTAALLRLDDRPRHRLVHRRFPQGGLRPTLCRVGAALPARSRRRG